MTSDTTLAREHDDAPATTSKTSKPDRALFAETVTINRPAKELYAFWRSLSNLTGIMENIQSIEEIDGKRSRWTVKAPAGREVTWEALITEDIPGESLTWQSVPDAEVTNSGRVEFREAGARGTVVHATIAYDPPGGAVGQFIAKLFQREPRLQTRRDLRRFKQMMETGEIATAARTRKQLEEEQA